MIVKKRFPPYYCSIFDDILKAIRFLGKAYVAPAGKFALDCAPALRPSFGSVGAEGVMTPSAAILVGMLSTAYMAHFNAPKVRLQLFRTSRHRIMNPPPYTF